MRDDNDGDEKMTNSERMTGEHHHHKPLLAGWWISCPLQ